MDTIIAKVRRQEHKLDGKIIQTSKLLTVPKKCDIEFGDYVTITKLEIQG